MSHRATVLVFSAHAADFVWRAGGAIALYASRAHPMPVVRRTGGKPGRLEGAWNDRRARKRLKSGELGLDIYGLRNVLAKRGVVWRD